MKNHAPAAPASTRTERALVLATTLLALGLRAWGLDYGFPQGGSRPDEERWVRIGLGLIEDPNPRWFQWPSLHAYLLATVYWLWGAVRVARGDFASWHAFLNEDQGVYPADLVLLGRWLSAALGALVVPVTWRLGERLGPRGAGLLAALFMAVSFGPVRDAHWALIESFLLLLIVTTLLLVARAVERPSLGRFALAGIAAGLTASAKYSGLSVAVPILVAALVARRSEGRSVVGTLWDRRLVAAGFLTVLAFFAGSPYILASWDRFAADMSIREWSYRDASFGTSPGFVHHALFSMRYSHGLAMEIAGIAGLLAFGFRRGGPAAVTLYGLLTYAALGPARIIPMRYASSIAPVLALGAAWLVLELARRGPRPRLAVAAAALALAAEPTYRCVAFDRLLAREDTRVTARRWLDERLPPLTRVLVADSKAARRGRPPLEDRYHVITYDPERPDQAARRARRLRAEFALVAESPTGYNPWAPEAHAVLRDAGEVVARFDPYAPGAEPVYDPHDAFFVPVAGFRGVRAPGPRITVYSLH